MHPLAFKSLAIHVTLTARDRRMLARVTLLVPPTAVLAVSVPSNATVGEPARLFVAPPSLAAPFLGGMFAGRGGPIVGLLMGLWAALATLVLIVTIPAYQAPATLNALLLVPAVGLALGAAGVGIRTASSRWLASGSEGVRVVGPSGPSASGAAAPPVT